MEKITRSDWTLFSLKMKIKRKNLPKTFCSIFWVCKKKKKKSSSLFWTVSSFFGHSFFLSSKLFFPSTLSFLLRFFPHHLAPFFNSPSFWPTNHFFWDLRGEEAKTHCRQRRRHCRRRHRCRHCRRRRQRHRRRRQRRRCRVIATKRFTFSPQKTENGVGLDKETTPMTTTTTTDKMIFVHESR